MATGVEPTLSRIEERLARLEALLARLGPALDAAEKLPVGLAVATDSFDQLIASLNERGVDMGARLGTALRVLERVTSPEVLGVIEQGLQHHETASRILRSGAFDAPALEIISKLAASLASASASSAPVGLWGAMKAAGTSPVQHALGFAVALASRFGESLTEGPRPAELTRGEP